MDDILNGRAVPLGDLDLTSDALCLYSSYAFNSVCYSRTQCLKVFIEDLCKAICQMFMGGRMLCTLCTVLLLFVDACLNLYESHTK